MTIIGNNNKILSTLLPHFISSTMMGSSNSRRERLSNGPGTSSSSSSSSTRSNSRRKLLPIIKLVYLIIAILLVVVIFSNVKLIMNNNNTNNNNNNNNTNNYNTNNNKYDKPKIIAVKPKPMTETSTTETETLTQPVAELQLQLQLQLQLPLPSYVTDGSCAILLFGLPRSFKKYVLPSIEKNIIIPNIKYNCDYYIHYYKQNSEESGRSGRGGIINSNDIFLLNNTIHKIYSNSNANNNNNNNNIQQQQHEQQHKVPPPIVKFISDTNETFWNTRYEQIMKYRNTKNKDNNGQYKYFPYNELTYVYPKTIDNIVKQWHSINEVWNLMKKYNTIYTTTENNTIYTTTENNIKGKMKMKMKGKMKMKKYRRIAMIRNDVMYITPIDIYEIPSLELQTGRDYTKAAAAIKTTTVSHLPKTKEYDYKNNLISVIPNFAKYPINDRLIYGPYESIEIWASKRFDKIDDYANSKEAIPGMVMHSETFLKSSIVPSIKKLVVSHHYNSDNNSDIHNSYHYNHEIREDRLICFLRVRADGAIWYEDCDSLKSDFGGGYPGGLGNITGINSKDVFGESGNKEKFGSSGYMNKIYDLLVVINNQTDTKIKCRKRRLKDPVRLIYELVCK